MIFNLSKVFVAVLTATAVAASKSHVNRKRQTDLTACDFVFKPDTTVDSTTTDLVPEFNYVIGRSLALETGGGIFNDGSSFAENPDQLFSVHDEVSADGKTREETAAIINGWAGQTKEGLVANWFVESVSCA
ncbi:unnamed protein product [Cyclocybe aegerita]|uniref:Uncharacterized protein n=1 Tax=Cyclocybe aegerita TaxID=1973307 RepID=A0A8S0XI88_CYCAE|nr:unnamed protein product [Cyclocybe aegerita]